MAEYILARKTRNAASAAVHMLLNILFGIGSIMINVFTGGPLFGLLLVLISKWRVFFVRPRYIWANFKSSLLDIIIGSSIVLITYYSGQELTWAHGILAVFYCLWLIWIKPMTSEKGVLIQALICSFLGLTAASQLAAGSDSIVIVLLAFIIGYSVSRHILFRANDKNYGFATMVFGLIFSEAAWISNSWMIVYTFGDSGIRFPQIAILLTILTFLYYIIRESFIVNDGKIKVSDVLAPICFSAVVVIAIVFWFSNPIFDI